MTLSLNTQVQGSARELHCLGSYAKDAKGGATLCVEPTNWDRGSLAFEYLVVDRDEQAESLRDDIQTRRIQFLFLLKKDGPLRINRNSKLRLGLFGHPLSEIQPPWWRWMHATNAFCPSPPCPEATFSTASRPL